MLKLYRICRNVYNPTDPTGASQTPGRWHILGQSVLYFCSSLAMCILELKANSISFAAMRLEYHYIQLEINSGNFKIEEVPESFYSKDWVSGREASQKFGDDWYSSSRSLILKVRSAVLPTDSNFILNTTLFDFSKLKIEKPMKIPLDARIN
ncbi:MAG: RES family NAD+ phosphorylase [Ignavibacteria bacterium]